MEVKKIPTTQDKLANLKAASALKNVMATKKPGDSINTALKDPKVSADVVQQTVASTGGQIDPGKAAQMISPDPEAEKASKKVNLMKKMKKEHFETFAEYVKRREES